jgi:phosphoenolpyruvate synthase/pyruvate phosphate dikinase
MDKETKKEFDNLAAMVKRGFDTVDKKFEHVDVQFVLMGSKLIEHDNRFNTLEKKIDQTWGLIDGYVKSQEDFKEEFKIMKHKMTKIEKVIKLKLGIDIE